MKKIFIYLILGLFMITLVSARHQQMSLLSAHTIGNQTKGDVAKIDLEIKPGQSRVFFQSFPLSQVDTQITTRFAKQYACDFLDVDCSGLDFFYTISAPSTIIGGPSAGAAITVLTIATLDNVEINKKVIMTGTINSGGIIGPVGATEEKINAATKKGFNKVLISRWIEIEKKENFSLSLDDSSSINNKKNIFSVLNNTANFKIETVKVGHITEALFHFTGKNYSSNTALEIPSDYLDLMNYFSVLLCNKTNQLEKSINLDLDSLNYSEEIEIFNNLTENYVENNLTSNKTRDLIKKQRLKLTALKQHNNSKIAFAQDRTYSQASFCFGANLALRELELLDKDNQSLNLIYNETLNNFNDFKEELNLIKTDSIIKLQTKQLVVERMLEAEEYLENLDEEILPDNLAYFMERFYSAKVWSKFFDVDSEEQTFNQETLKSICNEKIMQAQERIAYIELQTYFDSSDLDDKLNAALTFSNSGENEMCIYLAAQAKARADLILSTAYLHNANLSNLVNEKLQLVETEIAKEINEDLFPIAGISYLQYAKSLKEQDPYSSLLYAEYAIELGKMKMYLPRKKILSNLVYYLEDFSFLGLSISFSIIFFLLFYFIFRLFQKSMK